MTPEDLARQTGWSVTSWRGAQQILGAYWWSVFWRPVAELAGYTGQPPDVVAGVLVGDEDHPGLVGAR